MIRLIALDHIKTKGDFKLDGIWIVDFHFRNHPEEKQALTVQVMPFAYMDDGSKIWDKNRVKTIQILDAEEYLINSGDMKFLQAYFATEDSVAKLLSDRTEWTSQFEMPGL